ncbi:MAG: NapC/NirT family cytochrome c [Polyangiaceae bacterium]
MSEKEEPERPSSDPDPENEPEASRPPPPSAKSGAKLRPLYYNIVSHLGGLLAVLGGVMIAISMLTHVVGSGGSNPYIGIFTFMVFPGVMITGIVIFLLGMRWEAGRRRRMQSLEDLPYPRIDLNDKHQRKVFAYSTVGGVVLTTLVVWASYQGFHFTESVYFCGQVCHVPMEPEFTAYQDSAHARVPCVDCHVGEGAGWYVKSKLSGARQVLGVITGNYKRPIPTPIEHLRPARETCERCHWPQKFFGATLLQLPHYRYNETNDSEQISLTLKTGGGSPVHGRSQGIHWHMVVANSVSYVSSDPKLQVIPWTKVKHADGSEETYYAKTKLSPSELLNLPERKMDCMDCHNRPAHSFPPPDAAIDQALMRGRIATSLPWIKKIAVESVFIERKDKEMAHDLIGKYINEFYEKKYPDVYKNRKADIDQAVTVAKDVFDRGVFPKMNVDWETYPVNIGHRYWPGCFRCHDGKHVSKGGKVLVHECNGTCHSKPERGKVMALGGVDPEAQEDWHPWRMPKEHLDIDGHDMVLCHQCHKAGQRPSRECKDCHEK